MRRMIYRNHIVLMMALHRYEAELINRLEWWQADTTMPAASRQFSIQHYSEELSLVRQLIARYRNR